MLQQFKDKPDVVILGGGPGAIYAFYGALSAGFDRSQVQIWADRFQYPPGAFWLHKLPPNVSGFEASDITIRLLGEAHIYSWKQWGAIFPTSAGTLGNTVQRGYNPHTVLPQLWHDCNTKILEKRWNQQEVLLLAEQHKYVIVTFPITTPARTEILKLKIPVYTAEVPTEENHCIYGGVTGVDWVRLTRAFGHLSVEYPSYMADTRLNSIKPVEDAMHGTDGTVHLVPELHPSTQPIPEVIIGRKQNVLITGRWATLNRKALSHDSYADAVNFLREDPPDA